MSISDIKYSLRKIEFPASAKEALIRIEQLLVGRAASSKQMEMTLDIISEFVFCEDRRGGRRGGGLNPLQELQLIDIICDYLCACASETTKNTLFLSLFGGTDVQKQRLKILSILASMAVSASSTPVLLAVGVWLQQMGCSSPQSLQLVENVIRDHFFLNTSNQMALKSLADTAPQFVSNFITAVTELYKHDVQGPPKMPPKNLLEIITSWVYSSPPLCVCAQLLPAPLPLGAIPMGAVTPLAGLVHWCALAPHCRPMDTDTEMVDVLPIKKIKLESSEERAIVKSVTHKSLSEAELYMKLHLGVLNSLRAGRRTHGPPTAVNAQHLVAMVPIVQAYAQRVLGSGRSLHDDESLQECLNRIGQAVQVALANGCVYGNINNLLAALDTLPENRLLKIIIRTHQQTI